MKLFLVSTFFVDFHSRICSWNYAGHADRQRLFTLKRYRPHPPRPLAGNSQPYITNTYTTELFVNVRAGPSSVYYGSPIGELPEGATAAALAITSGHDWIEISFPSAPNGVGWVYAPFVTLTGSPPIIEPPPTFTPIAISTIDPTLMATYSLKPTETRLPTFTPPAPLVIPTFSNAPVESPSTFSFWSCDH